ncbi:MAG: class I SAM-dependent methyltransferase [Patescibacteria group bacterium]|jgi:2-polyprenyl-3-methyl-5-hydroxy-6-metoxy-1,4-benzoquinol methylase
MECRLCQSKKIKVLKRELRYKTRRNVLSCQACGFIFLAPSQSQINYQSKDYRKKFGPSLKRTSASREIFSLYSKFQEPILKNLRPILNKRMKVLDIGCSTGHFLSSLKGLVGERVGLELSRDAVNFIRRNLDFKVYSKPLGSEPIKEGPFDLITCLQVLEHIENPAYFLKEVEKNLKPGGWLYIEVPNVEDALLKLFAVKGYFDFYFREAHVSYFSQRTLKMLLAQAGFKGKIFTAQCYNILNHINWVLTGSPQDNFQTGNSAPGLAVEKGGNLKAKREINKIVRKMDIEYKKILEKNGLGENIVFLGKKNVH